jgi:phosphohistidine swiveling domain-containing protein
MEQKKLLKIMYDQTQYTPVYYLDCCGLWLNEEGYKNMEKISGYAPDTWLTYTQNIPHSFFFGAYDEKALEEEAKTGLRNFTDPIFLKSFEHALQKGYEQVVSLKEVYMTTYIGREVECVKEAALDTARYLEDIRKVGTFLLSYYFLTQPQRFSLFESELQKGGLTKDLEMLATHGRYLTYISRIRKTLVDYVGNIASSDPSEERKKVMDIVNQFGFLNWSLLGGELIDEAYVEKEIAKFRDNPAELKREKATLNELEHTISVRNSILKETDSYSHKVADIMGHSSVLRFDLQTLILCIFKYADNLIREVRDLHGILEKDMSSHEYDEILDLLKTGKKVPENILFERQKGYLRIYHRDVTETYTGNEAHEKIQDLLVSRENEIKKSTELTGTVASWPDKDTEIIQGRAFVLTTAFGADDVIRDMKSGDILVATQTHPNLVPKMKEALAIVTDEGGITCHAAIVSRELKKPCIIGTRLATKIFKTGDFIELNFKKGKIRKLIRLP